MKTSPRRVAIMLDQFADSPPKSPEAYNRDHCAPIEHRCVYAHNGSNAIGATFLNRAASKSSLRVR